MRKSARAGINGLVHSPVTDPGWRELNVRKGPKMEGLISALVENQVVVDPTFVVLRAMYWGDDMSALEWMEPGFAPGNLAEQWRAARHPYSREWSEETLGEAKATFPKLLEIFRIFIERGVLVTAGTDVGNPWVMPGVSFHRELELLAQAGIPLMDVLTIATRNGSEGLGILVEVGTVEEGKVADLVILTADPLADIKNTRQIQYVVKEGKMLEPEFLLSKPVVRSR